MTHTARPRRFQLGDAITLPLRSDGCTPSDTISWVQKFQPAGYQACGGAPDRRRIPG